MTQKIACCGLDCLVCPAYQATIANDEELKRKTAEEWSATFLSDLKPEDVNCLGCHSELLCRHCATCDIRICCIDQSLDNCAKCDFFICDKLEAFLEHTPEARKNLEEIKRRLSEQGME